MINATLKLSTGSLIFLWSEEWCLLWYNCLFETSLIVPPPGQWDLQPSLALSASVLQHPDCWFSAHIPAGTHLQSMPSLSPSRWKILTNHVSVTLTRCSPGSRELEHFNRNEAHIQVFWLHEDSGPEASQHGKTHLWLDLAFILFLTGKWKCQHKGALTSL